MSQRQAERSGLLGRFSLELALATSAPSPASAAWEPWLVAGAFLCEACKH